MCQRCEFIKSKEELPHNIMQVFHEDVVHEIEPRVEIVAINIKTSMVNILHRPLDMGDIECMDDVVPYTRIEVPIIGNDTISPKDVTEAVNLFPADITMAKIKDYMNSIDDDPDYIVICIESRSPISSILEMIADKLFG